MPFEMSQLSFPFFSKQEPLTKQLIDAIPVEGVTFLVASVAIRIFSVSLSTPLVAIGLSIIATRLLLKIVDNYDHQFVVDITKEVCKFNRTYPQLQTIAFISALIFSFTSQTLSFFIGISLGSFSSIILDVEKHKLLQQLQRARYG